MRNEDTAHMTQSWWKQISQTNTCQWYSPSSWPDSSGVCSVWQYFSVSPNVIPQKCPAGSWTWSGSILPRICPTCDEHSRGTLLLPRWCTLCPSSAILTNHHQTPRSHTGLVRGRLASPTTSMWKPTETLMFPIRNPAFMKERQYFESVLKLQSQRTKPHNCHHWNILRLWTLPIGIGAGSPYFIPTPPWGKSKSWHTSLIPVAALLSLLPAGPGMGCFFVYKGWYWWKQTVEACETSSSGGLWEGAWDFPCSSSSSLLELSPSLPSRIYLRVTPSQKLWTVPAGTQRWLVTLPLFTQTWLL